MTADQRFERDLPDLLAELLAGPAPDYRDAVLLETGRLRQRPSWTFPERWLPMQAEGLFRTNVPPFPWRALAVLALLAVLVVGALILVGSPKESPLPAPFGPAANGRIAVDTGAAIVLLDPATGARTELFRGSGPLFSPDGRRILYFPHDPEGAFEGRLAVAHADGTGVRLLEPAIPEGPQGAVVWSPDSTHILYTHTAFGNVFLYDASGLTPMRELSPYGYATTSSFRPPDGRQVLFAASAESGFGLNLVDLATGRETRIFQVGGQSALFVSHDVIGPWTWSPDGSRVAVSVQGAQEARRIQILSADGAERGFLTDAEGLVREEQPQWSPDGSRILFRRWTVDASLNWVKEGWSVARVDGSGMIDIRPGLGRDMGAAIWSPDGRFVLVEETSSAWRIVELETGAVQPLTMRVRGIPNWQRLADPADAAGADG